MTDRQRVIGLVLCIATILLPVLDTYIVSAATVPIVSDLDGGKGGSVGGIVAGAGMALGPWLGGALADHADWRWIFYVDLPVGLAVLAAAVRVLKLPVHTTRRRGPGGTTSGIGRPTGHAHQQALDTFVASRNAVSGPRPE
nr:MFS transporter [Streptomyces sp. JV185]